ncbi:vegetative incompatibility protein het-e-1 [Colletotrichum sojae]|uniref:Mitochondrial division protein 1 n=1 Tax=Colletotrichum sojae TaxID=2175907 RepID=A0A8H6IV42_9PEZI|nr:vegetative incompatibility protein het-e-1 [Colletotrichum sojae]
MSGLPTTECAPSPLQVTSPSSDDGLSLSVRAYDTLKSEEESLVCRYETLLSRELGDGSDSISSVTANDMQDDESPSHSENQLHTDPRKRRAQLEAITDRGLRRAAETRTKYTIFGHEFVLKDQVAQATKFFQAMSALISEAAKASPEAGIAWSGVSILLPLLKNPSTAEEANRDGLSYVTSRLRYYIELEHLLWPENLCESGLKVEFESHIVDLYQHILEFQIKSVLRFFRRWLSNTGRDMIRHDDWKGMLSKIKDLEQVVGEDSTILNTISARDKVEEMSSAAEQHYADMRSLLSVAEEQLVEQRRMNKILEDRPIDLHVVHEARHDSSDVQDSPKCETGTRSRILESIQQWADDDAAQPLFWMAGPAGTGKSTIDRTAADTFARGKWLVAGYFFKKGDQTRNDTARIFPTLAMQLAEAMPAFKHCLRKSLNGIDKDAVEKKALDSQFDTLLFHPMGNLRQIDANQRRKVIIVVDALDECERVRHLSVLLSLLCKLQDVNTVRVRFFLTSRSAPEIISAFKRLPEKYHVRKLRLNHAFPQDTKTDIRRFLKARFADIKTRRNVQQEPWPELSDLDRLIELATNPEPLFIYAATLCHFVYDEHRPRNPKSQLRLWLKGSDDNRPQLGQIYDPILSQVFQNNDGAVTSQQLQFLGALALLATPLSTDSLSALLDIDVDEVNWWLPELHAVLDIPAQRHGPIRLLHKSFSDFLLRPKDSKSSDNRVDANNIHAMLATNCIQRMQAGLKQDMCDIRKPGTLKEGIDQRTIDTHIPADLQYACLYWVHHLLSSGRSMGDEISMFLYEHFLHWLEALSLLDSHLDGAAAIEQLFNAVQLWGQRLPNLGRVQGVKPDWDARLQTLEDHESSVDVVAFSADGQLLASACPSFDYPRGIHLWHTTTDTKIRTFPGHGGGIKLITFSSDGQLIASASEGHTALILWESETGKPQHILESSDVNTTRMRVAPNGQVVASKSDDGVGQLRDSRTDTYQMLLLSHGRSVYNISFSPDSELVGFISSYSFEIWTVQTGMRQKTLSSVDQTTFWALSRDGNLMARSLSSSIRIHNSMTGARICTLNGHDGTVEDIVFSPDSRTLASRSINNTIRLWDTKSGTFRNEFKSGKGNVRRITFSPNGELIAFITNKAIAWWDVATGVSQGELTIPENVRDAVFSPNSRLLAVSTYSIEGNCSIFLQDLTTNRRSGTLSDFPWYKTVENIVFSPDSQLIAVSFLVCTMDIWSAQTQAHLHTLQLKEYDARMQTIRFSPDGQTKAASQDDKTVLLWSTSTGRLLQEIRYDTGFVLELIFTPHEIVLLVCQGISGALNDYWGSFALKTHRYRLGDSRTDGIGLTTKGWITRGADNILWLPPEYRPGYVSRKPLGNKRVCDLYYQ